MCVAGGGGGGGGGRGREVSDVNDDWTLTA